jgi:hypothetical protein
MVRAVVGDEVQVEAQVDSIFASRKPVQVQSLVVVIAMIFLYFDFFGDFPAQSGSRAALVMNCYDGVHIEISWLLMALSLRNET